LHIFTKSKSSITVRFADIQIHFGKWTDSVNASDFPNTIDRIRRLRNSKPGHS